MITSYLLTALLCAIYLSIALRGGLKAHFQAWWGYVCRLQASDYAWGVLMFVVSGLVLGGAGYFLGERVPAVAESTANAQHVGFVTDHSTWKSLLVVFQSLMCLGYIHQTAGTIAQYFNNPRRVLGLGVVLVLLVVLAAFDHTALAVALSVTTNLGIIIALYFLVRWVYSRSNPEHASVLGAEKVGRVIAVEMLVSFAVCAAYALIKSFV